MRTELDKMVNAIQSVDAEVDEVFDVELLRQFSHDRQIIICGVGKSFAVASLAACLLQSVGLRAVAQHATDLCHGGLNFISPGGGPMSRRGLIVAISHSGETEEVLRAAKVARPRANIIGISGSIESQLSYASDLSLVYEAEVDGSKHGTIPTASIAGQLAWINHITCLVADKQSVSYLKNGHPGGQLGVTYEGMNG